MRLNIYRKRNTLNAWRSVLMCSVFGLLTVLTLLGIARADMKTESIFDLSAADRAEIEKYLGRGVVGRVVDAPVLEDPSRFFPLNKQDILTVKAVYGNKKGKTRQVHMHNLERSNPPVAWRLSMDNERWLGEIQENGDVVLNTTENEDNDVISRYNPPEPVLIQGMRPKESKKMRIDVTVYDLARPTRKKYSGYLNLVYTYIGAFEVTVPAGTYNALLFGWNYDGKVGPASIQDDQYWFFAEGIGPIARIDKKDISAMLIYHDQAKVAEVLVSRE